MELRGRKVIALGERDGVPGPALAECASRAGADVVLTLKSQERRQPRKLREAVARGRALHVLKSNTVNQIQGFLRGIFDVEDADEQEMALREVEEAISEVLSSTQPVELSPQNSYVRRLQHQLIQRYGLASESRGEDPFRRVVIFPR